MGPCTDTLLLLLEVVLLQLHAQQPSSQTIEAMNNSTTLTRGMLTVLEQHKGQAAAQKAAAGLLQAVVHSVPPAVLAAAAAAGCEGLRPAADGCTLVLAQGLHSAYASLVVLLASYAGRREWGLASRGPANHMHGRFQE